MQGWVCIVKTNDGNPYCLCKECEAEWETPEAFFAKNKGTHFRYPPAIDLSNEEIESSDWNKYVLKQ